MWPDKDIELTGANSIRQEFHKGRGQGAVASESQEMLNGNVVNVAFASVQVDTALFPPHSGGYADKLLERATESGL